MPSRAANYPALSEEAFIERANARLEEVYGPRRDEIMRRLMTLLMHQRSALDTLPRPTWSERDQIRVLQPRDVARNLGG